MLGLKSPHMVTLCVLLFKNTFLTEGHGGQVKVRGFAPCLPIYDWRFLKIYGIHNARDRYTMDKDVRLPAFADRVIGFEK